MKVAATPIVWSGGAAQGRASTWWTSPSLCVFQALHVPGAGLSMASIKVLE